MLGMLLCGCTTESLSSPSPSLVTRCVQLSAQPATRTQLAPDGVHVLWSPGDTIGVFVRSGTEWTTLNAPLCFEGDQPTALALFSGNISLLEGLSDYTLYAYYPYAKNPSPDVSAVPFVLQAVQQQSASGDSSHLGASDLLVAAPVRSTTGDFTTLSFRHAFAVIEVDLVGEGALAGRQVEEVMLYCSDASTVDVGGNLGDVTNMAGTFRFDLTAAENTTGIYQDGSAQITYCGVHFVSPPTLGAEAVKAYITLHPADYSRGSIYLAVKTTDGYLSSGRRAGLLLASGQLKLIEQTLVTADAPLPGIDLTGGGPRANSYIASRAGQTYLFDATVAGNGMIPAGLADAVQRFEGRGLSAALAGGYARLLWQSVPHLIDGESVALRDGNIHFSLTTRPTQLGGNAVIGLFPDADPASEALWSWHIWITDEDNGALTAAAETYVLNATYEQEYGPGSVQMMDRNLGAIEKEDSPYARSFRAPLFQWGRKDPMPWGKVIFDAKDVPHNYLAAYPPVVSSGLSGQWTGYTGNTHYATAHPEVFIVATNDSSFDWYWGAGRGSSAEERNNSLWGNPLGYDVGQKGVKTLFDPCPPGWMMPHPYAFSGFTKTGNTASANDLDAAVTGTFIQGWNLRYNGLDATFYPGVGFRYDEFGVFAFAPSGYYWSSASAPAAAGAWVFGMTSATIYQRTTNPRAFGLPVRCMRDVPTP